MADNLKTKRITKKKSARKLVLPARHPNIQTTFIMEQMNVPEEWKVFINYDDHAFSPAVKTFRPLVWQDDNDFCCLLGPDPQAGVFGCGSTAEEALKDWDSNLADRLNYRAGNDEVFRYIQDSLEANVMEVN